MTGFVYAIDNGCGAVKIGWATSPQKRLRGLNTASAVRLTLVATRKGSKRDEADAHDHLKQALIRLEWFLIDHPKVAAFIAAMDPYHQVEKRASASRQPAASIIGKFGGATKVAEIVGRHRSQITRWTWPKSRGGSDGRVPQEHIDILLAAAAKSSEIKLSLNDFFPAAVEAAE